MMEQLDQYIKTVQAIVPVNATTADATTATAVNATGFDRAQFVIYVGAMDATCVVEMQATQSDASAGTYAAISGSALTDISSAGASKLYMIDVPVNGSYPYLKLKGTSGTARCLIAAICNLYKGSGAFPKTAQFQERVFVA
jgi:hypothetical protein